ncbi:MAG TPA: hypothetical protein VGF01_21175 [Terracidiphilus sp.]
MTRKIPVKICHSVWRPKSGVVESGQNRGRFTLWGHVLRASSRRIHVWDGDGTNSEGDTFFNPKDAVLSGNDIYPVALSGSAGSITFPLH